MGIVLNPELCDPFSDSPADSVAAHMAEIERNDCFFDPLFGREWPAALLDQMGARQSDRQAGDLAICAQPLDFIGLNYYTRSVARAPQTLKESERGYAFVAPDPNAKPLTDIGWEIYPEGLSRVVKKLAKQWPMPPIWMTENGAADNTGLSASRCDDDMRCDYLFRHLEQVAELVKQGFDIRGYYVWSLLDNFEWAHGYSQRFGIVHVDFNTQARTPKKSARMLQELLT
jgi:beta-glucosidase